ncbi:1-acyl-sn-glycerol-3-phosphate acyltransferase [Pedobacter cryophilus]|uniref:1-acyl-sn-glycerol-3-phosphate acyltransferase n=1 Tax=Pedobacter cryophilus TaxID=2571271 RepID=A0A4U1BXD2_9SPHI|nr:1-acyl-sn-glycerol-3-phosphate acyltransferase [Pedobacter cryophilus]
MKRILRRCLLYQYLFMVILFFVLLYPFLYYFSRKQSRYPQFNKVRKCWAYLSSAFSGIFYKFEFKSQIDWSKTYIICPNHASNLDISAMTLMMKNNFFFLGKEELLKNPFMRIFFETIDIPINRDSKIAAFRAIKKVEHRLHEKMSVIIFPEGKIGADFPPQLHEFKNGPFKLAITNKIPILPVTIHDNWKIFWDDGFKYGCKPGVSHICVHEPIETDGYNPEDEDLLKDLVYQKIASGLNYKL